MTTEMIEVINVAPLFNFIYNLLALLGALSLVCLVIFLTYSNKNIGIFAKQNSQLVDKLLDKLKYCDITHAETNLCLENNYPILNLWKSFDKVQHKRRRSFVKKI